MTHTVDDGDCVCVIHLHAPNADSRVMMDRDTVTKIAGIILTEEGSKAPLVISSEGARWYAGDAKIACGLLPDTDPLPIELHPLNAAGFRLPWHPESKTPGGDRRGLPASDHDQPIMARSCAGRRGEVGWMIAHGLERGSDAVQSKSPLDIVVDLLEFVRGLGLTDRLTVVI